MQFPFRLFSLPLFCRPAGLVLALCAAPFALAQNNQCLPPLEHFETNTQLAKNEVSIRAKRSEIIGDQQATFDGQVQVTSNRAQIAALHASVNKRTQQLIARGEVSYRDQQLQVKSDSVTLDNQKQILDMQNTRYRLSQFGGRGDAERILLNAGQGIVLQDVKFTTCPEGGEDWSMQASSIELETGKLWGEAYHTRFYVGDVPVFYLPYFVFPVTDQRQSGLLLPEISSSSRNGISYAQPYYWNIAPNYDATFTPRYMSDRGLQIKGRFRYLSEDYQGQLDAEYLPNDRALNNQKSRYFYRIAHNGWLSEQWNMQIDYNHISDNNYINDLGSDFYGNADTHLYQTFALNYLGENLDMRIQLRDFDVLGDTTSTYRALPEWLVNYQNDLGAGFKFHLHSELAHFKDDNPDNPSAWRLHLAPSLLYPYRNQWSEWQAEVGVLHTRYQQDNIENTTLNKSVDRTLGQARLYGALFFERPTSWFGKAVTQTLEPKAQYLYTSYQNQQDIGLYDTTRLLLDSIGLFRNQEFTGLDRISDNNRVTLGFTSRILDTNAREQFSLSLGQIFYLERNKLLDASKDNNRSALAGELNWRIGSKWFARSEVQLSTQTDKVERSSVSFEYQLDNRRLLQINHRYVRDLSGETVDQLGLTASWRLAEHWQWVGRWYKDMERGRTIESYSGIEYSSCCWALALTAQRHLTRRFNEQGQQISGEFDNSINLLFSIRGLGSTNASPSKMLGKGLFGYRQPYVLNH